MIRPNSRQLEEHADREAAMANAAVDVLGLEDEPIDPCSERGRQLFGSRYAKKPLRNPRYLAFIREQNCAVRSCRSWRSEAAHTGDHGLGQKSSDYLAIPLCHKHHRAANDSYHQMGRVRFAEHHQIDIPELIARLQKLAGKLVPEELRVA